MYLCRFSLIISEIFQPTNRHRYQFAGEVITDILSKNEKTQRATLGIPKRMKNAVFTSIAFSVDILIRNETTISEGHKTKNHLN